MTANMEAIVSRLESVTKRLEAVAGSTSSTHSNVGGDSSHKVAATVVAFDEMQKGPFQTYLACSTKIGDDVKTHSDMVKSAFAVVRDILIKASRTKQPSQEQMAKVLQPLSTAVSQIQDFREKHRSSKFFNHLSAMSESVPALAWVAVSPTPGPYIKDMMDAGQFYTNRVLKDFKDKDATHTEWVKAWLQTLTQMQAYVKQHHTTGLAWNAAGVDASTLSQKSSAPPPPTGGAPPPPPPPPASLFEEKADDTGDAKAQLFADLNKGEDVTKGLRKVKESEKTHKNPTLRDGPKPFIATKPSPKASPVPAQKSATVQSKPPRVELEGKKWIVEHHQGNKNIQLNDTNIKQAVYIFNCNDCTIQIKGKVNSIVLDSCKKTGIVFDSVLAAVEFVNCRSVQGQVMGKVPTVSIDKTDGCMVYLSKDSIDADIVVAKSSEMNILIPDKTGEYKEYALPEQYKTKFHKGKMVTTPVDSA